MSDGFKAKEEERMSEEKKKFLRGLPPGSRSTDYRSIDQDGRIFFTHAPRSRRDESELDEDEGYSLAPEDEEDAHHSLDKDKRSLHLRLTLICLSTILTVIGCFYWLSWAAQDLTQPLFIINPVWIFFPGLLLLIFSITSAVSTRRRIRLREYMERKKQRRT